MKFFGKNKPTFINHIKISKPYIVPVFSDKPKYTLIIVILWFQNVS